EAVQVGSGGNGTTSDGDYNYTTITSPIYPGRKTQNQYWAEVNWDLGPVTATYQGAYRSWKQNDHNLLEGNFLFSGASLQQMIETPVNHFHTEELRFASNGDSALSWQGGLFYYNNKLRTSLRNFLVNGAGDEIALQSETTDKKDTRNIGAFAEATYAVNPSFRVTLGARYDDTKVTVSEYSYENQYSLCGTAVAFTLAPVLAANNAVCTGPGQASVASRPGTSINNESVKYHNFNYKARLEYDLAQRNMVYASVSTGFRPGDIGISQGETNRYRAEKLTSYEIGSKNRFLDNTLQVNLAAYYYVYDGFQTTFRPDNPDNPADFATNGTQVRINVPARNLGGELEVLYQPTNNDRITINYNYVRSRWVNRPQTFAEGQPGTTRAGTPHTVTGAYQHVFNVSGGGTIAARIDGKFESAHLTQNLQADLLKPEEPQYYRGYMAHVGDRAVGNAQITFTTEDKRYSLTAYVRNFTNAKYPVYDIIGNVDAINVNYADPRIIGIVAGARF
ncbi:TonB-dependent receptor, partial [Novosphingobium sp. Rr 2-17]|uniref:TonB-dependent receptor domain-containing protein n=1 Tax=Novosphingobium sp. Rr 2-17 TaxID=555793 RepID=UPI0002699B87